MKKIVLNLKAYSESSGSGGLKLAEIAGEVADESGVEIIVCPQHWDLSLIANKVKCKVFAQHVEFNNPGAFTGSLTIEGLKNSGGAGTLINHAERKVGIDYVGKVVEKCNSLDLETLACADSIKEAVEIDKLKPTMIALEPPELIGTGVSVSTAKPDEIIETIKLIKNSIPLAGAGISSADDVRKAFDLGLEGVLLASAFVKAKNPKSFLESLASVF
ncbi:MAG: triose-phosphate isomerase [Candidatus Marsarchaeota archaeon]|nr:triose-phosphate isomerase [Candidatus Marsarchaeota archaeon]